MSFPVTDGVETVMPPPPGWTVNFDHPTRDEDVAKEAFWITGFELLIATGFLGQRLYTKLFIVKKLQIDDYLLILAYIGAVGAQAILLQAFRVGLLGTHAWELSVDEYNQSAQMVLATTLTCNVESNLLIMCGSLPTLKLFLNHVAPRILKDRSKKDSSGHAGSSNNYNLRTFGQGSITPRRKFDTLVDLEHGHFDRSEFRPIETGKTDVVVHGGQADRASVNSHVRGDTDSEEAILQIRTTTVAFSKR
ncbi:hypothetical protein Hte_006743 [Hypoxylon texense]